MITKNQTKYSDRKTPLNKKVQLEQQQFIFPKILPQIKLHQQATYITNNKTKITRQVPNKKFYLPIPTFDQGFVVRGGNALISQTASRQTIIPKSYNKKSSFSDIQNLDLHQIDHSINGSSIYQFSEFDGSDLIMQKFDNALQNNQKILPIINEISNLDPIEMKNLAGKVGLRLIEELQKNRIINKQWLIGFATVLSFYEDSLIRQNGPIVNFNFLNNILEVSGDNINVTRFLSTFLLRLGQQINFIRDERLTQLAKIIKITYDHLMSLKHLQIDQFERILQAQNLMFRSRQLRHQLQSWVDGLIFKQESSLIQQHNYILIGAIFLFYNKKHQKILKDIETSSQYINEIIRRINQL